MNHNIVAGLKSVAISFLVGMFFAACGEDGKSVNPNDDYLNPNITYDAMTDSRDNKTYKTVTIGEQTWMAENLNYDPGKGGAGEAKYDWSWSCNTKSVNRDVAGRLYTWAAAMDSVKTGCGYYVKCSPTKPVQGICPNGWHLPSLDEWNVLFLAVGGESTAGKVLKSQTGWLDNGNGTDGFGFAALPVGFWSNDGKFLNDGKLALFWSSTEDHHHNSMYVHLDYDLEEAALSDRYYKNNGLSIRCLKN